MGNDEDYANNLIWSSIPYKIGKAAMGSFFIFRLYFIFKASALRINKWIIFLLITLLFIGTCLGCFASIAGPKHLLHWTSDSVGISPALRISYSATALIIVVEAVTMFLYIRNLMRIVLRQAEVSVSTTRKLTTRESTGRAGAVEMSK